MIALPTFRGVLSGFSPLSLSPALWLSDTGSDASVWPDISGRGYNLTQTTAGARPAIISNELNGRQVRRFDGGDYLFSTSSGLGDLFKQVGGITLVAVVKTTNVTTNLNVACVLTNGLPSRAVIACNGATAAKWSAGGRRLDSDSFQRAEGATSASASSFYVVSSLLDYSNSDAYIFVNGSQDGANTSFQTDGLTSNFTSAGTIVGGSSVSSATNPLTGDMAEILIFPTALSNADRQRVERYLGAKYAITVA